jgi:MFS transporter, DHA1 family, multidrug resistance protein
MIPWKRNLGVVWISQFFAMAGMSSVVPFLPLYIRELGVTRPEQTAFWSGLVFAAPFMVSFFVAPVWGSLGDKYGRKLMTIRAVFGLAAAQLLVGFAGDVYQLFFFRMLQGALSGFYPAAIALVASNTPRERNGYAIGMVQSAATAGNIVGPLVGGSLADAFGFRNVFFIVGGLILLTGVLVAWLVEEINKPRKERAETLVQNWKTVLSTRQLRMAALFTLAGAFSVSLARPVFVLYVETFDVAKSSLAIVTGALYSVTGVFTALSSAWLGRSVDKRGVRNAIVLAAGGTGAMYVLHSVVYDLYLLAPLRAAIGFAYGVLPVAIYAWIGKSVEDERKGAIFGVTSSFQILGIMLGSVASGSIASAAGFRFPFALAGVTLIGVAVVAFFRVFKNE